MNDDAQLFTQLREQPDVQARAAMLGVQWGALLAARSRLLVGAWLISIGLALLALAQPIGSLIAFETTTPDNWYPRDFLIQLVGGGFGAYCARLASMYIARRVSWSPLKGPDRRRDITAATITQAVVFPLLTLAVCLLGFRESTWLLGIAAVAPIATIIELRPVTHFPIFLARNSPVIGPVFTNMREFSPLESLLGLRIRWILTGHLGVSAFALGATLLISVNGWLVLPVLAVGVVLDFARVRLSFAGRPVGAALVQLVLGVVVLGAALAIYAAPLLNAATTVGTGTTV